MGQIVIDTSLDLVGLEKELKWVEARIRRMQKDIQETTDSTAEENGTSSQETENYTQRIRASLEEIKKTQTELNALFERAAELRGMMASAAERERDATRGMIPGQAVQPDPNAVDTDGNGHPVITPVIDSGPAEEQLKYIERRLVALQRMMDRNRIDADYYMQMAEGTNDPAQADAYMKKVWALDDAYDKMGFEYSTLQNRQAALNSLIDQGAESVNQTGNNMKGVGRATKETEKNIKKSTDALDSFGNMAGRIIKRMVLYRTFMMIYQSVSQYIGALVKANTELSQTLAKLKGAMITAFAPIWQVIVPALNALANILFVVMVRLVQLVAWLSGKTKDEIAASAEQMDKEAKAISNVGGAAKKSAKSLAKFDTINQLNGNDGGGGGAGAAAGGADFGLDIEGKIGALETLISGSLLVVGLILALNGHVALGVALMATGAIGLASSEASREDLKKLIKDFFKSSASLIVGAALVVLGLILAMNGHLVLGISLMAAGATALAVSVASSEKIQDVLKEDLATTVALVAGATLMVIGLILAFSGHAVIGIPFMIAGAGAWVAEASLNWDAMKQKLQTSLAAILGLLVGATLLAIGLILLADPVRMPLAIALIAAGATSIISAVALNWDAVTGFIREKLGAITGLLVGGALVAIGLILMANPASLGLGIGLIVAGIGALGISAASIDWDSLLIKIKATFVQIQMWWNFTAHPWIKGKIDWIKGLFEDIKDWIQKAADKLDAFNFKLTGIKNYKGESDRQYSTSWSVPHMATGGVIPANHEFLAVLGDQKSGTNIEAPLSTIVDAFRRVQGDQSININFTGDLAQLAYILAPQIEKENARVGGSMVNFVR